jgi:hypothetical protein
MANIRPQQRGHSHEDQGVACLWFIHRGSGFIRRLRCSGRRAAAGRELLGRRITMSGLGAGMMGGGRPSIGAIMGMMSGRGGSSVAHMLELRSSSRERPAGAPDANHFIPAGMQMGASLPLVAPPPPKEYHGTSERSEPGTYEKPHGRMLIYWGCGEHASAGEPMVIDFAKVAAGQIPPGIQALAKMGRAMGRMASRPPRPENSAAFGEWPNSRDSRPVPATASLIGVHRVQANYAPPIAFTLGQGQDFMPGLGLREAGVLPSGADRLDWTPPAQATGYALALFGQGTGGDTIIWTSGKSATMFPAFDYETPAEVKRMIAAGAALPPTTNECLLPAEVARAVPQGDGDDDRLRPRSLFRRQAEVPDLDHTSAVQDDGDADSRHGRNGRGCCFGRPAAAAAATAEEAAGPGRLGRHIGVHPAPLAGSAPAKLWP